MNLWKRFYYGMLEITCISLIFNCLIISVFRNPLGICNGLVGIWFKVQVVAVLSSFSVEIFYFYLMRTSQGYMFRKLRIWGSHLDRILSRIQTRTRIKFERTCFPQWITQAEVNWVLVSTSMVSRSSLPINARFGASSLQLWGAFSVIRGN